MIGIILHLDLSESASRAVNVRKNHRPIQSGDRQALCGVPTESDIVGVPRKQRRSKSAVSATLMAVAVLLAACDGKRASDAPPAPVVTVSKPLQREITESGAATPEMYRSPFFLSFQFFDHTGFNS